jgi:diguanylate cyclase (GGDEF)-like protein/PAS domain S-box-containing protein
MTASWTPSRTELAPKEVWTYRLFGTAAALIILVLGYAHRQVDPAVVDPLWQRGLVALACLAAALTTFFYRKRRFHSIAQACYYLTTLWVVNLLVLNEFSFNFALSLIVVVAAVSAAMKELRQLYIYNGVVLTAVLAAGGMVAAPRIHPYLYAVELAAISILISILMTARIRTQAELAASEERYALAAFGANDGLWDWDLEKGAIYFAPRWRSMLGLPAGSTSADPDEWFRRVHPADRERLDGELEPHLQGFDPHFESEHRLLHADGEYRWVLARGVAVRGPAGRTSRVAGSLTDITERKRTEAQLLHDAFHDALTGMPNRALFMDRLERLLKHAQRRSNYAFAVLFLDLDRFKIINDGLGHLVGDELLQSTALRLDLCVRQEDTVARLGGDEFGILLDGIEDPSDATRVAERVHQELDQAFLIEGQDVFTSASIGIALSTTGYATPEEVLRDADMAMYRAKAAGRRRTEMFDAAMHAQVLSVLTLENDLRRAVARGEFVLHYQPIVAVHDRRPTGFEALLRWQHPERGLLDPGEFIQIAEDTGLILPIGWWVLEEAAEQLKRWIDAGAAGPEVVIAVNLSGRQFAQLDLVARVDEILGRVGLPAVNLKLEITESAMMADAELTASMLRELRDRGVRISIDDFGTGYSSLGYLHRFPVDTLKIDRSFIARLSADNGNELVRAVVALADTLGLMAIAEGVETNEQLQWLEVNGCRYAQGFLFSAPVAAASAERLLRLSAVARRGRTRG